MKKTLLMTAALTLLALPVMAQNAPVTTAPAATTQDPLMEQISYLQNEWARIKYQIPGDDEKLTAIHALEEHAVKVVAAYPQAETKIWQAIILSTDAGIVKGMSALPKVSKAKELLESALAQNQNALEGSAHTSLGSLYYQVPGWPVGFGDDDKAEQHLKTALQMNPGGIDPNFFYGDFLLQDDRFDEAQAYLERALQAPDRPGRAVADAGRRQEIKAALANLAEKRKTKDHQFN